ncbi:HD domain-containing protein [Candidatus Peregrinibacteria bacterium]|nr:HD domain-containing protein [Candidatus Peregrinibacteria bacterium]
MKSLSRFGQQSDGRIIFPNAKNLKKAGRIIVVENDIVTGLPIGLSKEELAVGKTREMILQSKHRHAGSNIMRSNHTRYEHALGCLNIANLFFPTDSDRDRHIRMSSLIHDIGHPPYSHSFEAGMKFYLKLKDILPKAKYSLHEQWMMDILRNTNSEVNKVLSINGYDIEDLISIATGEINSPFKGNRKDHELSIDYLDSWLRDTFHGVERSLAIGVASSLQYEHKQILKELNIVDRNDPSKLADFNSAPESIIFKTKARIAKMIIDRQLIQHQLIYGKQGKAIEFSSVALFFFCLKKGYLSLEDKTLSDDDLRKKINDARKRDKTIDALALYAFELLQNPHTDCYRVIPENGVNNPNYQVRKTYECSVRINANAEPIHKIIPRKKQKHYQFKASNSLEQIRSISGKSVIELIGLDKEVKAELEEFKMLYD